MKLNCVQNKYSTILLFLITFATFPTIARSNDLEDAIAAMHTGDFAEAYCIMRPLAERGDADAQYNIGWMYLKFITKPKPIYPDFCLRFGGLFNV